ncbi:hypothetical protein FOQG_08451 [Fusarium oxysporum f. sp. raphani 54005]|uniref:Uncharacterized protein n=6 Tax=Fusarium oxysporum TaxID=5507 RepID=W9IYS9_FUSOX|nr:hypothetical protein FOYG_02582 [Fusarium oxysporum NRRL 32931]EWZ43904.1 hypothetical protein FOZG_04919 [Fusarium oxysporum Fo47]EWZ99228.1 hypothetical protein FOWG_02966 [Fusarium oxysporum f. sp. lycopersici MN25]EXA49179.1 hypothetical protein FOVG_02450 [Fusarium oxysporum f. sp. pisi HDV247]EXK41263.1 hypothetical protein FOMG_04746 [Fusarium oxysporum f. sp. melonis 26406]EXK88677.1 hypothetical protein FOQG_08451 [Fusarium oxysporum f. sp. raphani 54005]EXL61234.1 hypothetical pr
MNHASVVAESQYWGQGYLSMYRPASKSYTSKTTSRSEWPMLCGYGWSQGLKQSSRLAIPIIGSAVLYLVAHVTSSGEDLTAA